jgi:ATP-dependent helicase/nuclease subunit A
MSELSPHELLDAAEAKQRAAADPLVSAWVRANAGTGKTHVLVQRMLRLLLSGASPRSILCLTFTKNAAAEMETRVLAKLGEWATADRETLTANLIKLLGRAPVGAELAAAPCLFAAVIDAPGGLSIMTIHGFCERVLRRYSFEANVPPGFTVLTEEEARDALSEAQAQAFASAKSGPLRHALNTVVAFASEADFSRVLGAMLGRRSEIAHLMQVSGEDPAQYGEEKLRWLFNLAKDDTRESVLARSALLLTERTLREVAAVLFEGAQRDREAAARFIVAADARDPNEKHSALKAAFMTQAGTPRDALMTVATRRRFPLMNERLVKAQAAFVALDEQLCGLKVIEATTALLRLTAAIFSRYESEKRARAAVDFDDLIDKTLSLFSREDASDWVLYQLDGRIDHILVDEAQDTSRAQWEIIEKLTSDFFSGEGARSSLPTLFAVGDEKQSIYGFQGAAPEFLAENGARYADKAQQAGFRWRSVDLNLSFRTLAPVLTAVDRVTGVLPGLAHGPSVPHVAYRRKGAGLVELWEPERGEKEDKGTVWEPDAAAPPAAKPAEALAARIAAKIKHWLDSGTALSSAERAMEPGDILILLRKREPMAGLLQAALKREGIPVSGADRVALLDELAIMDLTSLASALLQPDDDLALAEALKSPLFGLSDDDLFKLSSGRDASLWRALEGSGISNGKYASAAARLGAWRDLAQRLSPFDFFSHILEAEGGRKAFAARLGAKCFDALDELLNLAQDFSTRRQSSLSEFLVCLRRGASEVKRETDQAAHEVRIMTVHGAKGLEANVVILADACSNRSAPPAPVYFVHLTKGAPAAPIWAVKGTSRLPAIAEVKDSLKDEENRELGRLLYVAMTRARDCLYITGFHKGDLPPGCWYETIKAALVSEISEIEEGLDFQGRPVWRCGSLWQSQALARSLKKAPDEAMPFWLGVPAPGEPASPILLPSRLSSESDGIHIHEKPKSRDRRQARATGILIHRLLEVLPQLPAAERQSAANAIASAFSGDLSARDREFAIESAFAALASEVFVRHQERALAEAGIAVTIQDHLGKRRGIVTGQVDRILFDGPDIHILDYKSGAVHSDTGESPHDLQLAAYRLALRRLYSNIANIKAALLNTGSVEMRQADALSLDALLLDQFAGAPAE